MASYDVTPGVDLPGPCEDIDEVIEQLEKLQIASGHERIDKDQLDSLGMRTEAKRAVHDPGGSMDVPDSPHSITGCLRGDGTQRVIETSTRRRHRGPGGRGGEMVKSGGVEDNPDCGKVVDSARYDGTHPSSYGDEHIFETNTLHQATGPEGDIGEKPEKDNPVRAESDAMCRDGPHNTQTGTPTTCVKISVT